MPRMPSKVKPKKRRVRKNPAPSQAVQSAAKSERLARVADCLVRGVVVLTKIKEEIGTSVSTVQLHRDIKELEADWIERARENIDAAKGKVIARLDFLYGEAVAAWEASRDRSNSKDEGNPRFLEAALKIVTQIATTFGITQANVTVNKTVVNSEGNTVVITDAERAEKLAAILEAARARRTLQVTTTPDEQPITWLSPEVAEPPPAPAVPAT